LDLNETIKNLINEISHGNIEVYNEFSVQFELAMYLREILPFNFKIQLERNIEYFNLDKNEFIKKEMDIVVFDNSLQKKHCIEIKYPTNGQYPEQMFKISKDVAFIEQLVQSGFNKSYSLVLANSRPFYMDKGGAEIYEMFRENKEIKGEVNKPTGKKD